MTQPCRQAWKLPVWGGLDFVTFGDRDEEWSTVTAGAGWVERVTKATREPWTDVYAVGSGFTIKFYLVAGVRSDQDARIVSG